MHLPAQTPQEARATFPGFVLMADNTKLAFKAVSARMAIVAAQRVLGLRSMCRKAFRKAKAVAIFFGIQAREIFPFRQHRAHAAHTARMMNQGRIRRWEHKDGIDIGRRRHYVPPGKLFPSVIFV